MHYGCLLVPVQGLAQVAGYPLAEIEQVAELHLRVEHCRGLAIPDDSLGNVHLCPGTVTQTLGQHEGRTPVPQFR
jgi:hypothetical protein